MLPLLLGLLDRFNVLIVLSLRLPELVFFNPHSLLLFSFHPIDLIFFLAGSIFGHLLKFCYSLEPQLLLLTTLLLAFPIFCFVLSLFVQHRLGRGLSAGSIVCRWTAVLLLLRSRRRISFGWCLPRLHPAKSSNHAR